MIINRLKELEKNSPDDVFIKYSIAMAYLKMDQIAAALDSFSHLVEKYENYLPTYQMYGNLLAETGDENKAKIIYQKGMELAKKQQNNKTYNELEQALFLI